MTASLRRVGVLLRHELRQVAASPRLLLALFGVPLALTILANLAFAYPGPPPADLAVQDLDHSALSQRLGSDLLKTAGLHVYQADASADPEALVAARPDSLVVLVLPAGLEQSALLGTPSELRVVADRRGQSRSGPALDATRQAAASVTAVASACAAARVDAVKHNRDDNAAAALAERTALRNLAAQRSKLTLTWLGTRPGTVFSRQGQFATGNGVMFMMFLGTGLAALLASDRESGRLRRMLWTRLRLREVVAAKAVSTLLFSIVLMALLVAVSVAFFGMPVGPSPALLLLITVAAGVAVSGFSLLVLGLARTGVIVQAVGTVLTLALSAIGGSWWPQEIEPSYLRQAGHVSLNAWASDAYHALLFQNQVGAAVLTPALFLAFLGIVQGTAGALLFARSARRA